MNLDLCFCHCGEISIAHSISENDQELMQYSLLIYNPFSTIQCGERLETEDSDSVDVILTSKSDICTEIVKQL